jgi:hypothetical protein
MHTISMYQLQQWSHDTGCTNTAVTKPPTWNINSEQDGVHMLPHSSSPPLTSSGQSAASGAYGSQVPEQK